MTSITLRYDAFNDDFIRRFPLPTIDVPGVSALVHEAVDRASNHRQIAVVLGDKGVGKSFMVTTAHGWFIEREASRGRKDEGYQKQGVRVLHSLRHDTYVDVLAAVQRALDAREPVRDRGRKRPPDVMRERICALLEKLNVTVLMVDECEVLKRCAFEALRDIVAESADRARARAGKSADALAGTGLVVVGAPSAESELRKLDEYGQRLMHIVRVPRLTLKQANDVISTWLPQVQALPADDRTQWRTLVRMVVCQDGDTTFRHLRATVLEYARVLDRAQRLLSAEGWEDVPVDLPLFEAVAKSIVPPARGGPRGK